MKASGGFKLCWLQRNAVFGVTFSTYLLCIRTRKQLLLFLQKRQEMKLSRWEHLELFVLFMRLTPPACTSSAQRLGFLGREQPKMLQT